MSSAVATPPVGLCGELRKIAFARGLLDETLHVVEVGTEVVLLRADG